MDNRISKMNILRPTPIDPYPGNQFFQHIEEEFEKLYARSPLPKICEDQLNSSSDSAVFKSPPRKNVGKEVSQSQKAKIFLSLKNNNNSDSNQSFLSENSFSLHREKIRQPHNHSNVLQGNSYRELSISGENNFNNYMENDNQRVSHDINWSVGKSKEYSNQFEDGRSSVSEIDNLNDIDTERQTFIDRNNVNLQGNTRSPVKAFLALKNSSNNSFSKSSTIQNKENVPAILNNVYKSVPLQVDNPIDNGAHSYLGSEEVEMYREVYRENVNVNTEIEAKNCNGDNDEEESNVEDNIQDIGNVATGYDASIESDDENDGQDNDADVEEDSEAEQPILRSTDCKTDGKYGHESNNQKEKRMASDENKKSCNNGLKTNFTGNNVGQMNGNQELESQGQQKERRKSCRVHVTKLKDKEIKMLTETSQSEIFSQEVVRVRKSRKTQESEGDNTLDLYNDTNYRKAKQNLYTWIIKKHEFSDGICVEGKKRMNDADLHCSDVVTRRLSPKFIETSCGAVYCLIGDIKAANCVNAGFSKEIIREFKKGFPENWKKLLEDYYENNNRINISNRSEEHLQDVSGNEIKNTDKRTQDVSEKEIRKPVKGKSKSRKKEHLTNKSKSEKYQEKEVEDKSLETSDRRNKQVEATDLHLWIIKRISHLDGVCVEGKKSLKDDYFWHSGIVTKRISSKIVETSSGSRYKLVGDIETLDCLDAGFSKEVIRHFKKGFPVNWRELIEKPTKPSKKTSEGVKTPVKQRKKEDSDTSVYTPTGQVIQLDGLKKTRSGRVVKPQLAWWRGENLKIDPTNSILEVSYGSKHAEEFHKELAEQYKMSSKRFVGYKRISKTNTSQNIMNKSQNTSTTKKNNTLSQDSMDNTFDFMADLGSSVDESVDSGSDVQNVLNVSKQKKSKNKNSLIKSSANRTHIGQVTKTKKLHNFNMSKNESYSKSVKKVTNRRRKKKNDDTDKEEEDASNDDDADYVPNMVKKAKKVTHVKKNHTVSVLKNNDKNMKLDDSLNEEVPWQKQEIKLLQRAVRQVKKDAPQFWHKVADIVKTKSVEECQKFYYEDIETKPKKGTENKNKGQEQVKLTAKPGTLKRKQQVRDLLDQYNDGYEDDLFDSTPFRTKGKIKIPKIVDESIFDELAKANPDIVKNIKTPTTKLYIEAVSEKKTPASSLIISPFPTIDRKDADRCIRKMQMKRRQLAHHNKTKKFQTQTPVTRAEVLSNASVPAPISNLFNSASPSEKSLFFQEDSSGDNHDNSDEENDYYWSETEEA